MSNVPQWALLGGLAVPVGTGSVQFVTGNGLWHSTSAVLDPAAYIGAADQILVTNHADTDTAWITLTGDATYASSSLTVVALQGNAVSNAFPTNGQVLQWVSATSKWTPTTSTSALTAFNADLSTTSTATNQYVQSLSYSATAFGHGAGAPINVNGTGVTLNWVDDKLKLQYTSTTVVQLSQASTDFILLGATPAGSGFIRVPGGVQNIIGSIISGTSYSVLQIDGSNNITLSASSGQTNGPGLNLQSGNTSGGGTIGQLVLGVGGTTNSVTFLSSASVSALGAMQWSSAITPTLSQAAAASNNSGTQFKIQSQAAGSAAASVGGAASGISLVGGAGGAGQGGTNAGGNGGPILLTSGIGGNAASTGTRGFGGNITLTLAAQGNSGSALNTANNAVFNVISNDGGPATMLQIAANANDQLTLGVPQLSTTVNLQPSQLTFGSGITTPLLTQASESTVTKGTDFSITPQQSTHATDQGGGNLIVNLQTPTGAGVESYLTINRGGTRSVTLGPAASTSQSLWFGSSTPSATNYALNQTNAGAFQINAVTTMLFEFASVDYLSLTTSGLAGGTNAGNPFQFANQTINNPTTLNLVTSLTSAAQLATPNITLTGTISTQWTIRFGTGANGTAGFWIVDVAQLTFNSGTLTFQCGSSGPTVNAATSLTTTADLYFVRLDGSGHIALNV